MSDYVDTVDIEGAQYDIQDTATKATAEQNTQDIQGLEPVDAVQNNNLKPVTSNAVFKNWRKEFGQAVTITNPVAPQSIHTTPYAQNIVMNNGLGQPKNMGTGGSHAVHFLWTTGGYFLVAIDITVVIAIKGGTILTNE